ncbi:hypothetical protein [Vitiosangium sp. GDMCC 1.1324]|uniref:hypothetical protein n=1 Tax=Vitiosangium sp. (strain GDMCC 1.1324) TaxID=2138576 RepID=UPI0018EEB2A6|nr:hypothetical protein [Vitiosangium sp. GDMCC 1.1324]
MTTPAAALVAAPATLRRAGADPLRQAVEHLGHSLPERADSTVLLDFLEDDLREGLEALGDVEAHFADVLEALQPGMLSSLSLLQAGDDYLVLQRLELLIDVVTRVRRRLSQAAGLMRQTSTT